MNDQHDLDKIRMKKLRAMMEMQKRQEAAQDQSVSIREKIDYVLRTVLSPEAYSHLIKLQSSEPHVHQAIFNELITPEVIQSLDYLITAISGRGGISRKIPLDVIIMLERKIKGIKSTIRVQRDDQMMNLGEFLK